MKTSLLVFSLLFTQLAQADSLWNAYQQGIASCGVEFTSVNPNHVAKKEDFPGVPLAPFPSTSSTVVGEYHFLAKGALECGRAAGKLVKVPAAKFACAVSLGVYIPELAGEAATGATVAEAAKQAVRNCVKYRGYISPCLGAWVTCLSR